jgi:hypothetical protein
LYKDKNNQVQYFDTNFYPFYNTSYGFQKVKIYYDEENNTVYIYNQNGKLEETDHYQVYFRFYKKEIDKP